MEGWSVPNAARSCAGVSDMMPTTYRRSCGVSAPSTDACVGTPVRTCRCDDPETFMAIAHAATAITAASAATRTKRWDRPSRAVRGMEVETDISPLLWLE